MSEINTVQISDIGKVITGKTPSTKISDFFGNEYPFITPSDIKGFDARYLCSTERGLSEIGMRKQKNYILPPHSVCYVCIGSTIGKICMTSIDSFTNQQLNSIIVDEAKYNPWYVYYLLRYKTASITQITGGTGAGKNILNKTAFEELSVDVHGLSEQTKIASILSAYDNLIENNNRRIAILEEMAQRLYREWFVHFRFPGHENVEMVESELGMIPDGWQAGKVGDVCDRIFSGGTPATTIDEYWNGDLPWLSSGETRNPFIADTEKRITELGVDNSSTRKANAKDVVIASAGQGKTRGQTSYLLIDTYINQSVIALRGKGNVSEYLFINIKSRYPELRNASDSSSIRGSITTVLMSGLDIIIPDGEVLKKFSDKVSLIIKQIAVLQRKNNTLCKTRDLLLPRLISGDIDVSKIDISSEEDE